MTESDQGMLIRIDSTPASDSWGFVGRVMIGDVEAYRTLRAFVTPTEATQAVQQIVAAAMGPLLAGQEWRSVHDTAGRTPLREDLGLGLGLRDHPAAESSPGGLPG